VYEDALDSTKLGTPKKIETIVFKPEEDDQL
jgi:hypothetical protein